jgi:hypothetical protein
MLSFYIKSKNLQKELLKIGENYKQERLIKQNRRNNHYNYQELQTSFE